jgi:putative colanic acid biosysnthesis UDP-glucose lipid carrier transferase
MPAFLRLAFFIGDLILLNLSITLSYTFFNVEILGQERVNSIYLFIFSNLAWLFLVLVSNPYNLSRNWDIKKTLRGRVSFIFVHLLMVASLIFFLKKNYAPLQIAIMYSLFVPIFFLWKMLVLYLTHFFSKRDTNITNVVIVGEPVLAKEVRRYFLTHPTLKFRFLGLFEKNANKLPLEQIVKFCSEKNVNEIYCCAPEVDQKDLKDLARFGVDAMIRVKMITDSQSFQKKSLELEQEDGIPLFSQSTIALDDKGNQVLKRVFDVLFSLLVFMLILSWLFPIVALIIKLDSKGPVFFKQKRSGQGNKDFWCLKFRTMQVNPEADSKQAVKNDSRVTRVGGFLRKSSIDELPQFLNVLQGRMSVVGPRPHPLVLTNKYVLLINRYMARHYVKPGITGLAQATGYRGETQKISDMKNRVKLDRFYIDNWTFFLDIKIILLTVTSVFSKNEKAY